MAQVSQLQPRKLAFHLEPGREFYSGSLSLSPSVQQHAGRAAGVRYLRSNQFLEIPEPKPTPLKDLCDASLANESIECGGDRDPTVGSELSPVA